MTEKKTKTNADRSAGFLVISAVLLVALVLFDRWTKSLAVRTLRGTEGISLIDGVLELRYLENRGAAFGMLQGKQWFFYILTAVYLVIAIVFFVRLARDRRYRPIRLCLVVLTAGAIGNLIDRVANRYVVDFIYFRIIDFPIFNVADIYVTLSVVVLLIFLLFVYREETP